MDNEDRHLPSDPTDASQPSSENHKNEDISASTVFLEMMRQRAAQQKAPFAEDAHPTTDPAPATAEDPSPSIETDVNRVAARERLRVERVQRRRQRRRRRTTGTLSGILSALFVVVITATLSATVFTWWTGPEFLSASVRDDLSIALATATSQGIVLQSTALPATPNWLRRIGVVSGHRGPENDPGAVCPDGLTEAEINLDVAQRVVRNLQARGYTVDLLDEFDPRLNEYQADMLLSIHANTCQDYGEIVSGFLISTADTRIGSGNDELLVECVAAHYQQMSQLERRFGLTRDMTDYHIFREISLRTPAAILELGFLFSDRQILTENPDRLAKGITDGILCFLEPGDPNILATLRAPTPNPILPTAEPTSGAET